MTPKEHAAAAIREWRLSTWRSGIPQSFYPKLEDNIRVEIVAAIFEERERCAKIAESRQHICVMEACCAESLAAVIRSET